MKRKSAPRSILMAAGTAAVFAVAVAGATAAQPTDIRGTVTFDGGVVIPKGHIEISLKETASAKNAASPATAAALESDGGARTIEFSLPADPATSSAREVVVRLEREDGWLLARGSATIKPGAPVEITLFTVMY